MKVTSFIWLSIIYFKNPDFNHYFSKRDVVNLSSYFLFKTQIMKNTFLFLAFLFFTSLLVAQNNNLQKTEIKGDLSEVTLYYEDGIIMQHGFYTEDGKLHASWESYNPDGSLKCYATYNYGVKVGVWTYWNEDKITKVTYDNNKIIDIEEVDIVKKVKTNI